MSTTFTTVAPAFTGGRGSQLEDTNGKPIVGPFGWRPPSPAGEDRNS